VLVDENYDAGCRARSSPPLGGRRSASDPDQRILGELSAFVEFVCGAIPLDNPRHAVGIAVAASRQPHPCA